MKITFIGAGNLATHMAERLSQQGHDIIQVYSRTIDSASFLANRVGAEYTNNISELADSADFYVFSVKDSALESIIKSMPHLRGIWLHTAGSIPIDVFKEKVSKYGVLYPLQTFSKNRDVDWEEIPVFTEACDENTFLDIKRLAEVLSPNTFQLPSEKRVFLHTAAVFACNFANHMYEQAKSLSDKVDLPFEVLQPLIKETYCKILELSPHEAQTGPAIRFDTNVINEHLRLLENEDSKKIYEMISKSIHNSFK